MSRQPREYSKYQHIIVRGIGKQILFEDDSDRRKYLKDLRKYSSELDISILAYCLMDNHVHLLVCDKSCAVSDFMKKLGISYAQYYNLKYERTGHLFQDRYRSEIIKDDAYLLAVFRYILNNPQKAGIAPANIYRWNSFAEYGRSGGITDTSMLCKMIGTKKKFLEFLGQPDDTECMEEFVPKRDDAWAIDVMQQTLAVISGTELQQYNRRKRNNSLALLKQQGISIRQLERLTGISRGIIQNATYEDDTW